MGRSRDNSGLSGQADLLRAIVGSAHDAIYTVGRDYTILSWNPAAEALLGYSPEEIVGRDLDLLVAPDRRDDQREMFALISAGARMEPTTATCSASP